MMYPTYAEHPKSCMHDWRILGYVDLFANFTNIIRDELINTSSEVISKASIHKGITLPILRPLQIPKSQEMDNSFPIAL